MRQTSLADQEKERIPVPAFRRPSQIPNSVTTPPITNTTRVHRQQLEVGKEVVVRLGGVVSGTVKAGGEEDLQSWKE